MTMLKHPPKRIVRGDTVRIDGQLFEADGVPMVLRNVDSIEWTLIDENRAVVLSGTLDDIIEVTDATDGHILIKIPPSASQALPVGRYIDQLRVTMYSVVTTMWEGAFNVGYSAFPVSQE